MTQLMLMFQSPSQPPAVPSLPSPRRPVVGVDRPPPPPPHEKPGRYVEKARESSGGASSRERYEMDWAGRGEEQERGGKYGTEPKYGERKAVKTRDPRKPSREKIIEQELAGHLPMRDWCPHCVKGRGMEVKHLMFALTYAWGLLKRVGNELDECLYNKISNVINTGNDDGNTIDRN